MNLEVNTSSFRSFTSEFCATAGTESDFRDAWDSMACSDSIEAMGHGAGAGAGVDAQLHVNHPQTLLAVNQFPKCDIYLSKWLY